MPHTSRSYSQARPHADRIADGDPLLKLAVRKASRHGGYGWVRDLPDVRDFLYAAPMQRFPQGLPPSVDLRSECPPVYDQGQLGSCTANGIAGAVEFDQRKQGVKEFTPSRLFIYYNERVIEGTISQDSGAQVRDGIKSVATLGVPPEICLAVRHREIYAAASIDRVCRCETGNRHRIFPSGARSFANAGMPCRRAPLRLRIHSLRKFRERGGRPNGGGSHARSRRSDRWRALRGLRGL